MSARPLHRALEALAARSPDRTAILAGEERWTYADLERAAVATARTLVERGLRPGDRVAVMLSNRPEFLPTILGATKIGGSAVLLNPSWKRLEVEAALELTEPALAVADEGRGALLAPCLDAGAVTDLDDDPPRHGGDVPVPETPGARDVDDAVLVFSSGTTDLPKAVRHTHRSLQLATAHWCRALGLGPDDRFQVATPPSHILGLLNLLAAVAAGATVRLHRRFDLDQELHHVEADRMTLEMVVAPIALALAEHPGLEERDLSSLRYFMWGATPVIPSVAETVTSRTGVGWLPAYGTSEVPVITANPVDEPAAWRLDSAGLPVGDVEVRVADLDTGEVLAPTGVGEIQVRSASAMAGYLPAAATAGAFDEGWYRTGDVGWVEPTGWVHLTDRCKEMIKVRGFQVAPAEIEGVLLGHPAVSDCGVFGVPDERGGEVPVAAVRLEQGASVQAEELERLVAESLAPYKALRQVVAVDAVPRTPSGKLLRRLLREDLLAGRLSSAVSAAPSSPVVAS